jgi:hypothetical protein
MGKHSQLWCPFLSFKENEVLSIQPQVSLIFTSTALEGTTLVGLGITRKY